jgi:maltooligosyltrehalose synthase
VNVFTQQQIKGTDKLSVSKVLSDFPVALLISP